MVNPGIAWPVTLGNSFLWMARDDPNQNEFGCKVRAAIEAALPLVPGNQNPYVVTVAHNPPRRIRIAQGIKLRRNRGIQITCRYLNHHVVAQFHRKEGNRGIWISPDTTNRGGPARNEWIAFVRRFGVIYGVPHAHIPVELEFHAVSTYQPTELVVIRRLP